MARYGNITIAGGDTGAPLNLRKRLQLIAPWLKPNTTRLLDCGCGSGDYVRELRRGWRVDAIGLEYSFDKVQAAHRGSPCVCQGDLGAIPFAAASFDIALLNEVLEHVPDEAAVLAEIRRVLRPAGRLIVFSPNRWYPFETHGVIVRSSGKKLPPYVPFVPYVPVPLGRRVFRYWARNYWHGELRALIGRAGFTIESVGFVWQTFEDISGTQPAWMRRSRPVLRSLATLLERTPLLRSFGVSQMIVARRS